MEKPATNNGTGVKLNAFCVDLEEWFHIGGLKNPYEDISLWENAEPHVERDTDALLQLLADHGHKGTFLTVGWIAEKYPALIGRISAAGHEVGCHGYYHRMVWTQTQQEFREDLVRARDLLQKVSGQEVISYRAPCFSMKRECFWAYPILAEAGFKIDVSLVPAPRDNGGVIGFERDPMLLQMPEGEITVFPVSVLQMAGRATQFSGGGHLRAFPIPLIEYGIRQNHRAGRPVMAYIHPREINPRHPRVKGIPLKKHFTAYMGLKGVQRKLNHMLGRYPFGTVSQVVAGLGPLRRFALVEGEIVAK